MEIRKESIGKFAALGGTYVTHTAEKDREYRWPDLWLVPEEALIHEGETVKIPDRVDQVKPGSELTAIIGEPLWQASEAEAWDAIKGFTISNDVTASGEWPLESDPSYGGTGSGYKLFPTFSPVLSEAVEKQDRDYYADLQVEISIDGETIAAHSTEQLGFSIGELVSFTSHILKLEENDMVALGDPGEVRDYLDTADSVTCSIESIGELTNPVVRL